MTLNTVSTLLAIFLFIPSLGSHPSLFFTDHEIQLIQQNNLPQKQEEKTETNSDELYLGAIMYVDADHWTLWINHQMIHSSDPQQIQDFHIQKVTSLAVVFSWHPPQSAPPLKFTLRPHQMFSGKEKRICKF